MAQQGIRIWSADHETSTQHRGKVVVTIRKERRNVSPLAFAQQKANAVSFTGPLLPGELDLPMSSESFQRRVEVLRESWAERRYLKDVASSQEYEPQFQLLESLHRLAESAVAEIRSVYAEDIDVTLGPMPDRGNSSPAFSVTIGGSYTVTFLLDERRRTPLARWFVSATISSGGPGGAVTAAGPARRDGQWTRLRVEDIFLSVLGAYERGLSESSTRNRRNGAPGRST